MALSVVIQQLGGSSPTSLLNSSTDGQGQITNGVKFWCSVLSAVLMWKGIRISGKPYVYRLETRIKEHKDA